MDKAKWFPDSSNPLRVEPEGTWQHRYTAESYMRYGFALRYVAHRDVLDAGSGVCFGASLMSVRAKSVTCGNIEPDELAVGSEHFRFYCPMYPVKCDFNVDFPKKKFGAITSFEMIEHLSDTKTFLENVKSHLIPGGPFIFSIPKTLKQDRHNEKGERIGHLHEILSFSDAAGIIGAVFAPEDVKWYIEYEDCSIASEQYAKDETAAVGWMGLIINK